MTFAGKKLQDIYDSGAASLTELETAVTGRLKASKQEHKNRFNQHLEGGVASLRNAATELQVDLSKRVDSGLERLKEITAAEIKESQSHSAQMVVELSNLSNKLRASINALKEVYEENVEHITVSFSDRYLTAVEHSKLDLEKQEHTCSNHLRTHAQTISSSLQQKLDDTLWESRGEEKNVSGALFKSYSQKANAIESHFSSLLQKLSTDFQTSYRGLENESGRSETSLEASAEVLLDKIDEHATKVETRVNDHFQNVSDAHRQKLDGDLASVAEDLSSLHDGTTERLGQTTEELIHNLNTVAAQGQAALKTHCSEAKANLATEMQALNNRLTDRIAVGTALKRTLEADKDQILTSIRNEIDEIRITFESKVSQLIQDAGGRVSKIVSEAEKDVVTAQRLLDQSITESAQNTRNEIESQVSKFLQTISQHRAAALEDIAKAAESSGPQPKKP